MDAGNFSSVASRGYATPPKFSFYAKLSFVSKSCYLDLDTFKATMLFSVQLFQGIQIIVLLLLQNSKQHCTY